MFSTPPRSHKAYPGHKQSYYKPPQLLALGPCSLNYSPSLKGLISRFLGLDNIYNSCKLIVTSLIDPLSNIGLHGT